MIEQPSMIPTFHFKHDSELQQQLNPSPSPSRRAEHGSTPDSLLPLFLSIDAGVTKVRACILSELLEVVWTEEVRIDEELPEFGTRNGVYTLGDVVTSPSEMRIAAFELLLEKIKRDCPDPGVLGRVKAISGAGQPHALHYLTSTFPHLLAQLSSNPHLKLRDVLTSASAFSHSTPATGNDSSTSSQVRSLESHFGVLALPGSMANAPATLAAGRAELARRTGSKPSTRGAAAQLMKVVQAYVRETDEGRLKQGVVEGTKRIVLESGLLAAVFLGSFAPLDAADACSTNLFDPVKQDWDDEVLEYVMCGGVAPEVGKEGEGAKRLRDMLGEVEADGGVELGKISSYFVQRFGFHPDCLITPFTGPDPATFLSFPLYSSPAPASLPGTGAPVVENGHEEWRDALLGLSTSGGDTDVLMLPTAKFCPNEERALWCNPARGVWEDVRDHEEGESEEVESAKFVAAISSRDAGVGRALVRDLYANGEWKIFSHLSAIVPHGGTIGLDDKYFGFFFPHGEASAAQGFLRFVAGAKVQDFPDRKANPRLLLESQFMSLRLRLSHVYRSLTPALSTFDSPPIRPFDALGFPSLSKHVLPSRLIITGSPAQNPAISSLLSTMFCCPVFLPTAGGLTSFATAAPGEPEEDEETSDPRSRTTAAALGAAYKAAWAHFRSTGGERGHVSFQRFLREGIEELAAIKEEENEPPSRFQDASQGKDEDVSNPSDTFASSTSASSTAPTRLSLPRTRFSSSTSPSSASAAASGSGGAGSSPSAYFTATASTSATSAVLAKVSEESPEGAATAELEPDPPGLTLVAMPDKDEWKYYSSMLPEFARLERSALKGLI
ncbi:hypothetical protein JCM11641_008210 [Rhodosporidiobolus odoratus]